MSLRRLSYAALVGSIVVAAQPAAAAVEGQVVRGSSTASWSTPSPDPTGLAFDGRNLLISDAEVDEGSLWRKRNLFIVSRGGGLQAARRVDKVSLEPDGIAWWPRKRALFVIDDDRDAVFRFRRGRDGKIGTRDDKVVKVLDTRRYGSFDPEGLDWHAKSKTFIWVDATDTRVYRVQPGRDRRFGTGDDRVRRFATSRYGFTGPEGVTLDRTTGHLFMVSSTQRFVLETTLGGRLIRKIDMPFCGAGCHFSDLVFGPGTDGSQRRLYLTDRGRDNNPFPDPASYSDGKLYQVRFVNVP